MFTQRFSGYSLVTNTKTFQGEPRVCVCVCVCVCVRVCACKVYYVVYVFVLVLHVTVHVVLRGKLGRSQFSACVETRDLT